MTQKPLDRVRFDAANLVLDYPPQWLHANKQAVFDLVSASSYPFDGQIIYARWPKLQLPEAATRRLQFQVFPGVFTYVPSGTTAVVEWHMNFADQHLFVAYGSSLLAQDELQVAEHPCLGSLREALESMGSSPETMDSQGSPTPITISGAQRRCAIDTAPNLKAGRPRGLYGNAFARATVKQVIDATKILAPPTISNILAMAAPACGFGPYSKDEILLVLGTAYSGFLGARLESAGLASTPSRTVIHTGFWGCGAFGGNRVLMTILQVLAGELADVDIVFHAFDAAGVAIVEEARDFHARMGDSTSTVPQIVDALLQEGFSWGESDGN